MLPPRNVNYLLIRIVNFQFGMFVEMEIFDTICVVYKLITAKRAVKKCTFVYLLFT